MGAMIDTQVLVYACHLSSNRPTSKQQQKAHDTRLAANRERCEASAQLIERLEVVHVSAVTITEFCQTTYDNEIQWLDTLGSKLAPLPVDRRVAETASKILRARGPSKNNGACHRCLNHPNDVPCSKCGRGLSRHHRIADALIAATAELSSDVDTLYCYDNGVLALAPLLKRCAVRMPPDAVPNKQQMLFKEI